MNTVRSTVLSDVFAAAGQAPAAQPLQVYFDLDSTLFSVRRRTQFLLRRFATQHSDRFPQQAKLLENVEVLDSDWGIRTALLRLNIKLDQEFLLKVRDDWRAGFFSSEFLHLDNPYPGAVEYVQSLEKLGANIFYLTGRDLPRMGEGTQKALLHHGFPLKFPSQQLLMKPHTEIVDTDFKESIFRQRDGIHKDVWFFENEPLILHRLESAKYRLKFVYVDSTHSGRAKPLPHWPTIKPDYRQS